MPKEKLFTSGSKSSFSPTTEESKLKLNKIDGQIKLTDSKKLKVSKIAEKSNALNSQSSLPSPSSNQIDNSTDVKKQGTTKKPKVLSGRVKFRENIVPSTTLTKNKKETDKKKNTLRTRSNSVVVGTNNVISKKSGLGGGVSAKHKLKAKKNRAITNVAAPDLTNKSISYLGINNNHIERILTRSPLENALTNAAIQMNLSEELRFCGGTVKDIFSFQPLGTLSTVTGKILLEKAKTNLPNVKKISNGEGQKKSERNYPGGKSNNGSNNSRSTKSKTENTNGVSKSSNNEDEDPNKKKNKKKDDNASNSSPSPSPSPSTSSASPNGSKRKRKLTEESSAKISNENVASTSAGISVQSVEDEQDKEDEDKDAKKKKNRCAECRKKVGLTGFQCRCGGLYCAVHRYSDKHNCTFNYREHGAQEIRRNNPVVVGEKIQKI